MLFFFVLFVAALCLLCSVPIPLGKAVSTGKALYLPWQPTSQRPLSLNSIVMPLSGSKTEIPRTPRLVSKSVLPERRDAPDTLAINRLGAGWLPASAVAVVPRDGSTVTLAASKSTSGTRLAVIALDDRRFIAVELLTADGFDDHLPAFGVAVHLIEGSNSTRTQTPLVGLAPYTDLLIPGETLTSNGWRVAVGDGWRVTMQPVEAVSTVSG